MRFFGGVPAKIWKSAEDSARLALVTKVLKSFALYDRPTRNLSPPSPFMSDRHHLLRLWILGTLILTVTFGTLAGSLLRQWREAPVYPENTSFVVVAGLMAFGLIGVWFRNGHRLWVAAKAR
jgi:hypothetical protein